MKLQLKNIAAAVLVLAPLILSGGFPALTAAAGVLPQDNAAVQEELPITDGEPLSGEAPVFSANVEYSSQGYLVMGALSEFPESVVHIQALYSTDDSAYLECGEEWDLQRIEAFRVMETKRLICLYSNNEPLKSYLKGSLDRFYLKLRLTGESGTIYETRTALIDIGDPQPLPEEFVPAAWFSSNMLVRETNPFRYYGKYQITVRENAAPSDISEILPETLPVEVQLQKNGAAYATGVIDCPVTWKPLSLPSLTAGESVTVRDAAEEIVVPAGTALRTPMGIFQLIEPLSLNQDDVITDEVRLVLNVISEDEKPTGVLTRERDGLEMAFDLKPTGAASIQAYTISAGETEWTELSGILLTEAVNAQPSTASSGYTLVLGNDREPYRSYLAAEDAGTDPSPFFVGLKIKGGVFDGQQLILAWPNDYELPPRLPELGGAGGNENNAGADNTGDSTADGQRPNLPQNPDTTNEAEAPELPGNQNKKDAPKTPAASDIKSPKTQDNDDTPGPFLLITAAGIICTILFRKRKRQNKLCTLAHSRKDVNCTAQFRHNDAHDI